MYSIKNIVLFIGLFFIPSIVFSQKIFTTDYQSQADIKVFVVDYESQSDLKVFKVDYQSQSKGNEGLWYFVKYNSQSGWRNNSKKHLLY